MKAYSGSYYGTGCSLLNAETRKNRGEQNEK